MLSRVSCRMMQQMLFVSLEMNAGCIDEFPFIADRRPLAVD